MDVLYRIQSVEFEWNDAKAQSNIIKHGVTFNCMKSPDDEMELRIRPRPAETVTIDIPTDTLETLKRVAVSRDMSYQALIKLYIGQGLRQDAAQLYADRVLKMTAEVLARHLNSQEEIAAILREIHGKTAA
jgi:hypothetical protein